MKLPDSPINISAAWRGIDQKTRTDWIYRLSKIEKAELESAIRTYRNVRLPVLEIQKADYPLPVLGDAIKLWMAELDAGRGFILVRGFPAASSYSAMRCASAISSVTWPVSYFFTHWLSRLRDRLCLRDSSRRPNRFSRSPGLLSA
jgi:hypothetical protein